MVVGEDHGDRRLATVIAIAFGKVYVVGDRFMELRQAPLPLRLVLGVWCVAVCTLLVGIYLFAG